MQWTLGLDAKLYQAGSKEHSDATRHQSGEAWDLARVCTGSKGPSGILCSSGDDRNGETRYKTTDSKRLKSVLTWPAACDIQQLGAMPDLLGCSVNTGRMYELITNTDWGQIRTQSSKAFILSLSTHPASYHKPEFPGNTLGWPFSYLLQPPALSLWSMAWEIAISIWFSPTHLN